MSSLSLSLAKRVTAATLMLYVAMLGARPAAAFAQQLPLAHDLRAHAKEALKTGQPVVLLVSLPGCEYCERIRKQELQPRRTATAEPQVLSWQIDLQSARALRDFDGKRLTHDTLARRYRARFAPTVLFLGPTGEPLAEPLVGYQSEDFYGAYFEERLAQARQKLENNASCSNRSADTIMGNMLFIHTDKADTAYYVCE
jgi:thioredoxin-related protein